MSIVIEINIDNDITIEQRRIISILGAIQRVLLAQNATNMGRDLYIKLYDLYLLIKNSQIK